MSKDLENENQESQSEKKEYKLSSSISPNEEMDKKILELYKTKLVAVKYCKDTTGWDLRTAKDYCDKIWSANCISKSGGCFIATACYGNYDAPEVLVLRQFRDEKLLQSFFGKVFVKFYYSVSPFFATLISKPDTLKKSVRQYLLEPIVRKLQR